MSEPVMRMFIEEVMKMRTAQKDYFRHRTESKLNIAKHAERKVDELLLPMKKLIAPELF